MDDFEAVFAGLVVVAAADPRHAVVVEQQLAALVALAHAGGTVTAGSDAYAEDGAGG